MLKHLVMWLVIAAVGGSNLKAQEPDQPRDVITLNPLPFSDDEANPKLSPADKDEANAPPLASAGPHPLLPAMEIAYRSYRFLNTQVQDYSCRVVKTERINGRLRPTEYVDAKVRHRWEKGGRLVHPRSVYMKAVAPQAVAGREILWIEGRNDGRMLVRRGGRRFSYITVELEPDCEAVMRESLYPLTDMGMKHMVRRLIEIGRSDMKYGECKVLFFRDVKVDGRDCTCIQVTHPHCRPQFKYHVARIFVDDEFPVPLRFEAYQWPVEAGAPPLLSEQYTFQHLELNVGHRDEDFQRDNREYGFRK